MAPLIFSIVSFVTINIYTQLCRRIKLFDSIVDLSSLDSKTVSRISFTFYILIGSSSRPYFLFDEIKEFFNDHLINISLWSAFVQNLYIRYRWSSVFFVTSRTSIMQFYVVSDKFCIFFNKMIRFDLSFF